MILLNSLITRFIISFFFIIEIFDYDRVNVSECSLIPFKENVDEEGPSHQELIT